MNPPSLREICAKIMPGPWKTASANVVEDDFVNRPDGSWLAIVPNRNERDLIARFSPATALAVYEALNYSMRALASTVYANQIDLGTSGDNATRIADNHDAVKQARHALALLDGRTEP